MNDALDFTTPLQGSNQLTNRKIVFLTTVEIPARRARIWMSNGEYDDEVYVVTESTT
jgi:uncharacterized pyridoxamine 5'-phosphate oxidase family protein